MVQPTAICASLAIVLLTASSANAVSPFIFFFDTDSTRLDDYARVVIDNAAAAIHDFDAKVKVAGAADRAGSSDYNRRLARRRAEAVKAALVERGVKNASITSIGLGEDRPLVDTTDGVAERQNRYAHIVYVEACRPRPVRC